MPSLDVMLLHVTMPLPFMAVPLPNTAMLCLGCAMLGPCHTEAGYAFAALGLACLDYAFAAFDFARLRLGDT